VELPIPNLTTTPSVRYLSEVACQRMDPILTTAKLSRFRAIDNACFHDSTFAPD